MNMRRERGGDGEQKGNTVVCAFTRVMGPARRHVTVRLH